MTEGSLDPTALIIDMERTALNRWGKGDPSGFLEICASDVVYFDPFVGRRVDGLADLTALYEGIRGKVAITSFELINPRVQMAGSAAVLTFNFVSYSGNADAQRWNCTEVYRHSGSKWEIIQTHWSITAGDHK